MSSSYVGVTREGRDACLLNVKAVSWADVAIFNLKCLLILQSLLFTKKKQAILYEQCDS